MPSPWMPWSRLREPMVRRDLTIWTKFRYVYGNGRIGDYIWIADGVADWSTQENQGATGWVTAKSDQAVVEVLE